METITKHQELLAKIKSLEEQAKEAAVFNKKAFKEVTDTNLRLIMEIIHLLAKNQALEERVISLKRQMLRNTYKGGFKC